MFLYFSKGRGSVVIINERDFPIATYSSYIGSVLIINGVLDLVCTHFCPLTEQ